MLTADVAIIPRRAELRLVFAQPHCYVGSDVESGDSTEDPGPEPQQHALSEAGPPVLELPRPDAFCGGLYPTTPRDCAEASDPLSAGADGPGASQHADEDAVLDVGGQALEAYAVGAGELLEDAGRLAASRFARDGLLCLRGLLAPEAASALLRRVEAELSERRALPEEERPAFFGDVYGYEDHGLRWDLKMRLGQEVAGVLRTTLEHVEGLLLATKPTWQLTELAAMCVLPGEAGQPVHADTSHIYDQQAVTMFIALHDIPADQGPTRMYPRTHLDGDLHMGYRAVDESTESVLCELRPGDCVLMDSRLLHCGTANRSERARHLFYCSWTMPGRRSRGSTNTLLDDYEGRFMLRAWRKWTSIGGASHDRPISEQELSTSPASPGITPEFPTDAGGRGSVSANGIEAKTLDAIRTWDGMGPSPSAESELEDMLAQLRQTPPDRLEELVAEEPLAHDACEASAIASSIRALPDPMTAAWDEFRQQFASQTRSWEEVGAPEGAEPLRRAIQRALAAAGAVPASAAQQIESAIRAHPGMLSRATEAAARDLETACAVAESRQMLTDRLEASAPRAHDGFEHDVDAFIERCGLGDSELASRARDIICAGAGPSVPLPNASCTAGGLSEAAPGKSWRGEPRETLELDRLY